MSNEFDLHPKRITRSTFTKKVRENCQLETNGTFHYSNVTLNDIVKGYPSSLYQSLFKFFIPIEEIHYDSEKVLNRNVWVSSNKIYSANSDLVALAIHSSAYVPKKKCFKSSLLGINMVFKFLDMDTPKFIMRRKNGIRSRYSSKKSGKVVQISHVEMITRKDEVPKQFETLTMLPPFKHQDYTFSRNKKTTKVNLTKRNMNKRKRIWGGSEDVSGSGSGSENENKSFTCKKKKTIVKKKVVRVKSHQKKAIPHQEKEHEAKEEIGLEQIQNEKEPMFLNNFLNTNIIEDFNICDYKFDQNFGFSDSIYFNLEESINDYFHSSTEMVFQPLKFDF
ncbi:hypothetical protein M0813_00715 [Anaeramoeba flamelloides]|uniref:Uncharacterized protein n=1 Tax=Anaeramoeba flamelloides TaxID=1746091 RepID=A0ABQ8XN88_9EUKA|nr:hypothetical protein M0813_00715 [Anaeramoeba flamelloides]